MKQRTKQSSLILEAGEWNPWLGLQAHTPQARQVPRHSEDLVLQRALRHRSPASSAAGAPALLTPRPIKAPEAGAH